MPIKNADVELLDTGGLITGTIRSPNLHKAIAFEYQEWRDNIVMYDAPGDFKGSKQLAWLDPHDAYEVLSIIDKRIREYLKVLSDARTD